MTAGHKPWLVVILCCLVLAGCAGKLPKTRPIPENEASQAVRLWDDFLRGKQPEAIDVDLRLRWDVFGSKGGIDAVLQMKQPALLRFSANDPLGRSLILVVSNGRTFTFVDNREGQAYRGKTDARFWRRYVPDSVQNTDLFFYLGGLVDPNQVPRVQPFLDDAGQGFWYVWRDKQAIEHHVLLNQQNGVMQRHFLVDRSGAQLLDVRYSGLLRVAQSATNGGEGPSWPQLVAISGEAVSGEVEVQVEKVYAFEVRGTAPFRLTPPPHFTIEEVD